MGDESGFDPCECVWGHEMAMRRLLSMLRQSQSHCTDTECFVDGNTQPNPQNADYYMFMTLMIMVSFFIRYWLTQNQRTQDSEPSKPPVNDNGFNGAPPTPPTSS